MPTIGISEYLFFLITVLGIFFIRRRAGFHTSHRTWTINPIVFCAFSAFLVVRGIISDSKQGLMILILAIIGLVIYRLHFARELV